MSAPRLRTPLYGLLAASSLGFALTAEATEGISQHGYDMHSRARGGAGVGWGDEALSAASNPALLALVTPRYELALTAIHIERGYAATESSESGSVVSGSHRSGNEDFAVPSGAFARSAGASWTWGAALYGNGGINTSYEANETFPGPFGGGDTGLDLTQLFFQPSAAYRVNQRLSLGLGLVLAYQQLKAEGFQAFASVSEAPGQVTNQGYETSTGLGVRLGVQYSATQRLSFGASYQPRIDMSKLDQYAGLVAGQGDLDVPWSAQVGLAFAATDALRLYLDYREIGYGSIPAFANPITNPAPLGSSNGPGFGWSDIRATKVGFDWTISERVTLRAGYSRNNNPAPPEQAVFVIVAPGQNEQHISAGITYRLQNWALDAALTHFPKNSIDGPNVFVPNQTITSDVTGYDLTLGFSRRF